MNSTEGVCLCLFFFFFLWVLENLDSLCSKLIRSYRPNLQELPYWPFYLYFFFFLWLWVLANLISLCSKLQFKVLQNEFARTPLKAFVSVSFLFFSFFVFESLQIWTAFAVNCNLRSYRTNLQELPWRRLSLYLFFSFLSLSLSPCRFGQPLQ